MKLLYKLQVSYFENKTEIFSKGTLVFMEEMSGLNCSVAVTWVRGGLLAKVEMGPLA